MLTQATLKEVLHYNPITGLLTWKVSRGKAKAGNIAGVLDIKNGYIKISVYGKSYSAHRLAFLYIHGKFNKNEIDHINGIKNDNRLENLREVSHAENQQNRRKPNSINKTGYLGVSLYKKSNQFRAFICVNKINRHLGIFDTPEQAHEAYLNAKRKLHEGCTI